MLYDEISINIAELLSCTIKSTRYVYDIAILLFKVHKNNTILPINTIILSW